MYCPFGESGLIRTVVNLGGPGPRRRTAIRSSLWGVRSAKLMYCRRTLGVRGAKVMYCRQSGESGRIRILVNFGGSGPRRRTAVLS